MKTSLPDYTEDLAKNFGISMSREALHKKFNPKAVEFMKEVLKLQISKQFKLAENEGLRSCFQAVNIKDSSKFSLPTNYDNHYPGFGNFSKKNGLMNIQYEYDLLSGNWISLELTTIKRNDRQDSKETIDKIAKGALYDLKGQPIDWNFEKARKPITSGGRSNWFLKPGNHSLK